MRRVAAVTVAVVVTVGAVVWVERSARGDRTGSNEEAAATAPRIGASATPDWMVPAPGAPANVVLLGDSIAASMASALGQAGASRGTAVQSLVRGGCGLTTGVVQETFDVPLSTRCAADTNRHLDDAAARLGPGDAVLWFSSWEVNDHLVDGRVLRFRSPEWDAWYLGQLEAARERFAARGATLVLVTVAPRAPVQGIERQILPDAQDTLRLSEVYRQFAREHPTDVVVADLAGLVCPQGPRCPERLDGVVLRPDSTHYETEGAVWTAPRLLDLMSLALVRRPLPS